MKSSVRIMVFFIIAGAFFVSGFFIQSAEAIAKNKPADSDSVQHTLILLRHAKSDKSDMAMPDIHRPLEESGKAEAKEMGEYLKENVAHIDAIYSSPSTRTRQTLEIICPIIGFDYSEIIWDSTLYACSGEH